MRKRILSLLMTLTVLAGLVVPAVPVSATSGSVNVFATSDVSVNMTTNGTVSAHWDIINDIGAGHNQSQYLQGVAAQNTSDLFSVNVTPVTGATISEVGYVLSDRTALGGNGAQDGMWITLNGITVRGPAGTTQDAGPSSVAYSGNFTHPGGGGWSWTDINNLQFGVWEASGGTGGSKVWFAYLIVYYDSGSSTTITTNGASGISTGGETLSGTIVTSSGNNTIRGFDIGNATGDYSMSLTSSGSFGAGSYSLNQTSNLSIGTYYYRAKVFDATPSIWVYGTEQSFLYGGSVAVTTGNASIYNNLNYVFLGGALDTSNYSGGIPQRGFQVGSANGTWDYSNPNLVQTDTWTTGAYVALLAGFSYNTTYYYRAFATDYTTFWYGDVLTFTTNNTAFTNASPNVSTTSAFVNPWLPTDIPGANPTIVYTGGVISASHPIIKWGFITGNTSASVVNVTAGGALVQQIGTLGFPGPFQITDTSRDEGLTYYRAFAQDNTGLYGYGSTLNLTAVASAPQTGNITLTAFNTTVGQFVWFTGAVSNPWGTTITQYGFRWRLSSGSYTSNGSGSSSNDTPMTAPAFLYDSPWIELAQNTSYVWQAAILVGGNWTYSVEYPLTTGATLLTSVKAPTVKTHDATTATTNGFTTIIEIVSVNGLNATEIGLEYRLSTETALINAGAWHRPIPGPSQNYTADNYTYVLTIPLAVGQTVQYRAYAKSLYGWGYGEPPHYVTVSGGTGIVSGTTGGTGTLGNTFTSILKGYMNNWGMDNPSGHWAFMGIWMIVAGVIGIGLMIYFAIGKYGALAVKGTMVITLAIELVILGTFIFSGLLGIWPVIILIVGVIGWLFMIFGNVFNGGRQAANG